MAREYDGKRMPKALPKHRHHKILDLWSVTSGA